MSSKRTESISVKFSEKMKIEITKQARENGRTIQQEIVTLVAQGLHERKFSIGDHV